MAIENLLRPRIMFCRQALAALVLFATFSLYGVGMTNAIERL